jgi:hypothetical protein
LASEGSSQGQATLTPEDVKTENVVSGIVATLEPAAAAKDETAATALILLTVLDGMAVAAWGSVASFNDLERGMILPPLQRTLARLNLSGEVIARYSDPVLLVLGFAAWGMRVSREVAKTEQAKPVPKTEDKNDGRASVPASAAAAAAAAAYDMGKLTNPPADIIGAFRGETLL